MIVNNYMHMPGSRNFSPPPGAGAPYSGGPLAGPPADPFAGPPAFLQSVQYPGLMPAQGAGKGAFGLGYLADLKLLIDRMGGIEGILSTVQKVQKIIGTVQQFAPMIKLLAGSLGKGKAAAAGAGNERRPRRRRRRSSRARRGGRSRRGTGRRASGRNG